MAEALIASRKCARKASAFGAELMRFDRKVGAMVILIMIKN
jgi:hypothetical protein